MSLRKTATAMIIGAEMGTDHGFAKGAHRAVFNYVPKPGFLYVRSRAISSRCNDNFDMFPAEEIEKSYLTFIGKPVFVNHHNEDHRRSRGVIIDAALHKDINPDGSPDTWVELLHEVDAVTFPKLAKAILSRAVDRTSMGCDVQFSKCSVCHNVATSPLEYCSHIPEKKGKRILVTNPDGTREARLVYEICSGLSFFENSLLVEQPADPTAYFLGEVEYGPGLETMVASVQKTASKAEDFFQKYPDAPLYVEGGIYGSYSKEQEWHKTAAKTTSNSNSIWGLINKEAKLVQSEEVWNLIKEADRIGDDLDYDQDTDPIYWERVASKRPPTPDWQRLAKLGKLNDDRPYETLTPPKKITEMSDEEKSAHKEAVKKHAQDWMTRNPMHPQNIVDHWNAATPEEKENGENWYQDAHHTSKMIAHATNTPEHAMAGLISNYSPQTHWATNVVTAAKSARLKIGLGGKGNKHGEPPLEGKNKGQPRGIMASEGQRQIGHLLANAPHDEDEAKAQGAHYEVALKGPKTKAFARLIHNGGDDHSVVVDRHAFSVASGARASDAAYGHSGLGGKKRYAEAEGHYRTAAKMISEKEGRTIHPHQVQAATWLVRQRLNEEGDRDLVRKGSRSASAARSAIRQMAHYMGEHHPEASIHMPGTGYSKETGLAKEDLHPTKKAFRRESYGETKAPQDVDTLRAENCTVCGNSTAFDGVQCQICGYVAPPRPFGDPDTETAKTNDIRKQVLDSDGNVADPSDPDQQLGNQIGNPDILEDQADEAEEAGVIPALTCTTCGTGIQPSPPTSAGGEPPYPAEGDVCPVCKDGELAADSNGEADEEEEEGTDLDGDGIPDDEEDESSSADPFAKSKSEDDDESDEDSDDDDKDDKPKKK